MSMMDTNNNISSLGAQANAKGVQKSLGQEDFLRLMVAQFKNQDPTNPKGNGDFLAQLAQFSTNDNIVKMQNTMQQMATSLNSNQALQASTLVGRKVLVNTNTLNVDGTNKEHNLSIDLPAPVNNISATIYNAKGEIVREIPLGEHGVGLFNFTWDGLDQRKEAVEKGNYLISIKGYYQGEEVKLKPMIAANVDSVSVGQNGEGVKLNVAGVGQLTLDQIHQITG